MAKLPFAITKEVIEGFCRKWEITELAVFGSALRDDFRSDSDLDFLATFSDEAKWSVFDHGRMSEELSRLLGRRVDIVEKDDLNNPFRRKEILATNRIIYAS